MDQMKKMSKNKIIKISMTTSFKTIFVIFSLLFLHCLFFLLFGQINFISKGSDKQKFSDDHVNKVSRSKRNGDKPPQKIWKVLKSKKHEISIGKSVAFPADDKYCTWLHGNISLFLLWILLNLFIFWLRHWIFRIHPHYVDIFDTRMCP